MKTIAALYLAQAREFLRDRSSGFFVLILPITFGVFFGLVFGGGASFSLQLGIVNEDTGSAGEEFIRSVTPPDAEEGIEVITGTRQELLAALDKAELHVVLVVPENMTDALATGQAAAVEVYFDSSRQSSSGIGLGIVRTLINETNLAMSGAPRLLTMNEQAVQSHPFRSVDFYMPGMLGVALLWLGVFGTAQPVISQRTQQVYRRIGITPISKSAMLTAEVSWRVTLGIVQAATFVLVGYFGFQVGVRDWLPFVGAVLLGTFVFVSMGYVIVGLARSAESGAAIGQLIQFPMMMLSGSIMSADLLPEFFRPIAVAMPLTYLSDLLRQTMVGMTPLYPMGVDFAVLGAWFVGLSLLAVRLWRWE
jgi:ABC-2 type transport system permease protein